MTKYKIILVPFPFDDLSSSKVRPAVCLTEPVGAHRHVILAFITSKVPEELLETDIVIAADDEDFEVSGLRVSSTLRLHRLMTATVNLIQRELGQLSMQKREVVKSKLKTLFDLE
ncbi:MAG: type II toxin-antitoxin system PemK/MazF family toxin [Anaerolineales bacterium]|nr:type II toxin-antitoxin system PemK/MazF family toxin [Anaerolineales bacterium]